MIQDGAGPRTGIVLAAGLGSRLAGARPGFQLKPLTPVAGMPLILRTLRSVALAGCREVVIVVGYHGEEVQEAVRRHYHGPLRVHFAHNPHYELQNGLSVLAARPYVKEAPFLLTMADHVLGDELMALVRTHRPPADGATLLVDYRTDQIFDLDDATKVRVEDGWIVDIGKHLTDFNAIDTGVFVCTFALMDALEAVYREQGDASLSDGVRRLARARRMAALDIGDGFWQDVDTPEMLAYAERRLLEMARSES
ncbi:Nucleotidyl transferase [Rhodothermus marinus SG0.5JP17-172]|uniref:phosphocholine cytidylyltransferase family protein n=1 Tax=Rhodothermus marinus TaxID=29549 RepID=UPI000223DA25|nr:NTP transferase domain-containing protein [Rhodothermus marinus]AEN73534.1 Nucleotidyl transferase [Rhodothermus marinus SG0.5JP17-172]MBO2491171.1 nucleotidyltransferase [Rhodothermus marinus]